MAQLHAAAPLCAKIVACVAPARPHAVIDRDGDVVLTMASDRRTVVGRVFAGSDSAVRVGGEGGGPGEYRTPDVLGIAPDGDALVFDGVTRRLLAFAPDGTVRSTGAVRFPPAPLEGLGFVRGVLRMLSTGAPRTAGDSLPVHVFTLEGGSRAARRQHALSLRQPAYGLTELRAPPPVFAARDFFALREDGSVAFAAGAKNSSLAVRFHRCAHHASRFHARAPEAERRRGRPGGHRAPSGHPARTHATCGRTPAQSSAGGSPAARDEHGGDGRWRDLAARQPGSGRSDR